MFPYNHSFLPNPPSVMRCEGKSSRVLKIVSKASEVHVADFSFIATAQTFFVKQSITTSIYTYRLFWNFKFGYSIRSAMNISNGNLAIIFRRGNVFLIILLCTL